MKNNYMSLRTKGKVSRADMPSSLLYGNETWTLYRTQVRKLYSFRMRHLRDVMNISWKDKIQNSEILLRLKLPKMEDILVEKDLR